MRDTCQRSCAPVRPLRVRQVRDTPRHCHVGQIPGHTGQGHSLSSSCGSDTWPHRSRHTPRHRHVGQIPGHTGHGTLPVIVMWVRYLATQVTAHSRSSSCGSDTWPHRSGTLPVIVMWVRYLATQFTAHSPSSSYGDYAGGNMQRGLSTDRH
ncbi:hypothetical protein ACOMHN_031281 [Nucella lapillus]